MREPHLAIARPRDVAAILEVRNQAIVGTAAEFYGADIAADWASRRRSDTPGISPT